MLTSRTRDIESALAQQGVELENVAPINHNQSQENVMNTSFVLEEDYGDFGADYNSDPAVNEETIESDKSKGIMGETALWVPITAVILGVGALLTIILIPASFGYLEYYEYGFLRRKSTGSVDTSFVYSGGRHFIGPDFEFKTFPAVAHHETLNRAAVFTADRLEVWITVTFIYFLRKEDLPLLHDAYDIYYRPILRTNALDALKGAATVYTTEQFINERREVEATLFQAVRDRLSGQCCRKGCSLRGTCQPGCTKYEQCGKDLKGLFADVKYFYFADVDIPDEINDSKLFALTLGEETEKMRYIQQAKVVTKETDQMLKNIENQAAEIGANAAAQAKLIESRANSNATALVEQARSNGLKSLYTTLGITDEKHKASFDFLHSLQNSPNAHLYVDFQQLIGGPTLYKP